MKPLEKLAGFLILLQTAIKGTTHPDYARVVALAKKYKALITGENIDAYLIQFVRRETLEAFQQRASITQSITPAACEKVITGYRKIPKLDNVIKKINWEGVTPAEEETRRKEVFAKLAKFFGTESLDDYMEERFTDLSFCDPNLFIAVEFDAFDNKKEKASPRPFEITSTMAVNYQFINNVLQFLVAKTEITYTETANGKTETKSGFKYILYLQNDAITLTQIGVDETLTEIDQKNFFTEDTIQSYLVNDGVIRVNKTTAYRVNLFTPKSEQVPCYRIGYKRDLETDGRTMVSPLHPALPYLMKTLKSVSEFDLTNALHVFPQKFQYVKKCGGEVGQGCNSGITHDGNQCSLCKGEGYVIHNSAQDAVILPLPKKSEDMIDLDKLLVYKNPPIDLLDFQNKYINELEKKIITAVFNSEMFYRTEVATTATELTISSDNLYDTLSPFANKYSKTWKFLTTVSTIYLDFGQGLEVVHKFPRDLKLKSLVELLKELKTANDAEAPEIVRQELDNDLAAKLFGDDKDALLRYRVKQKFMPFRGKTFTEVIQLLNSTDVRKREKVLYSNFGAIFSALELKFTAEKFYMLAPDKQLALIDEQIDLIIEDLNAGNPATGTGGVPEEAVTSLKDEITAGTKTLEDAAKELATKFSISVDIATALLNA